MTDELYYAPGAEGSFVELSSTSSGKLFKKHILTKGPLYYGSRTIDINDDFLDTLVKNFNDRVVSHVQAPVVDGNNEHVEDPLRNIGEVVRVEREGDKLYSYIDVRDEEAAKKMGKTLLGASAMLSTNWKNTKTNQYVGPALIHTAITNNAHLSYLDDFEEVIAMSASSDSNIKAVLLSAAPIQEESKMDLDELIALAREEHGIDIPELQRAAAGATSFAKLSAQLQEKLTENDVLKLSNTEEATAEDIVAAVTNIVETNVELSAKVDTLVEESAKAKAEARVEELIAGGFIAPAKREAHLELLLSNPETFEKLLPEKPLVKLSSEEGHDLKDDEHDLDVASEIARLSSDAKANGLTVRV